MSSRRSRLVFSCLLAISAVALSCTDEALLVSPTQPDPQLATEPATPEQERPQVRPGRYLVRFRPEVSDARGLARALAEQHSFQVRHAYQHSVRGFSADLPPGLAQVLQRHPMVDVIEPVGIAYLDSEAVTASVPVPAAGLRVRLVADDLTLADGVEVGSWANTGSDGDAVQLEATRQPTYHGPGGSAFRGRAHVGFNEGKDDDEYLEVPDVADHGSGTLIAVFSQEDAANHHYGVFALYGNRTDRTSFVTRRSQAGSDPLAYWDQTNGWKMSSFVASAGGEHIGVWQVDGSAAEFQVDGTEVGVEAMAAPVHTPFDRYLIGSTQPSTRERFDGQVAELIFYDRVLLNCERDQIVADLGAQYGIPVSVTPGGCTPPAAPTDLAAAAVDFQTVQLTWTDNADNEDGFAVERRQGQTGTFVEVAQVGADITGFTDTGLTGETEYCYQVIANNSVGASSPTGISCVTTPAGEEPPPPPPVSVPAEGLRVRLVADELGLADGVEVGSWSNTGSDGDAVQGDATRQPTYHEPGGSAFGGRAHVGFNEGADNDEYMAVPNVADHGSGTLIAVFSQEDAASHHYGVFALYANQTDRTSFVTRRSQVESSPLAYWDQTNGWKVSSFVASAGGEHIGVWQVDGSAAEFQVDGTDVGVEAMAAPIHTPFDRYLIGSTQPSTSERFDGQVAELIFYDRVLLDCERDQVVADLGAQYGIPVSVTPGGCTPPAAPTDLAAAAVDYQTVQLTWTDNADNEDGFAVQRREGQTGTFAEVALVGADVTEFTDTGLTGETEYCYQVIASNESGASSPSGTSCVTTPAGEEPPPPPPVVSVPAAGLRVRLVADELTLTDGVEVGSWSNTGSDGNAVQLEATRQPTYHGPGGSAFGGRAHVGFNEGADNDEYLEVPGVADHGSGTLIAVFSQEDAAKHHYGVFALYGNRTDRTSFVTRRNQSGADPLAYWDQTNGWKVSSFVASAGGEHIGVWQVDGSAAEFQVDGTDVGVEAMGSPIHTPFDRYLIGSTQPSTKERFDGQVAELIFYDRVLLDCERDQVVADLGAQYGIPVSVTPGGCTTPAAPTDLAAEAVDYQTVQLTWTDNADNEDGFAVERRQGQTGAFVEVALVGADIAEFTDTGLTGETEYCYQVIANNSAGASGPSGISCVTTPAGEEPPPPPPAVSVPAAGLRVRLVADDLTLADGVEVGSWSNTGSDGDAVQGDATRQPTYHGPGGSAFGGRAHVGFNEGTDDNEYLEVPGVADHGSGTLIAVFSQEDAASHHYGVFALYANQTDRTSFVTRRSQVESSPLAYWDQTNGWKMSSFVASAGGEHIGVWQVDGSAADFQVDGTDVGVEAMGSPIHTPFDRYLIGATQPSTSERFDGQVAELIFYDRVLLDCERDQVVADLGARYGISVSVVPGGCTPPAAPTDLAAAAVDYQTVQLTWTDNADNEDGFAVERREGQTGTFVEVAQVGADITEFTDTGLTGETEYCYQVIATNSDGASSPSGTSCVTTPAGEEPPPPPPVVSVPAEGLRVRLVADELGLADGVAVGSWSNTGSDGDAVQGDGTKRPTYHEPGGGAFGGRAHVGFNEGADNDEYLEVPGVADHGSGTLVAVFSQEDAASHHYGVFALYANGTDRTSFVTRRSQAGADPLAYWDQTNGWKMSSFVASAGGEHIGVWQVDGSAAEFQVDGTDVGGEAMAAPVHTPFDRYLVGSTQPSTSEHFDGQVAELIFYDRVLLNCERDQIVADLGAQYGIPVSVVPGGCTPPAAPTDLVAVVVDYRTAQLTWTDNADNEDGFAVERREGQTGTFVEVAQVGADITEFTDRGLTGETEYCYQVIANNEGGASSPTGTSCVTTPITPPGACVDAGGHDDLGSLWNIARVGADQNEIPTTRT